MSSSRKPKYVGESVCLIPGCSRLISYAVDDSAMIYSVCDLRDLQHDRLRELLREKNLLSRR